MANRYTRFILKNNPNSAAPFSGATLLAGEPIVNTAAGIMMFSGVTTGTNDWVPAGPNGNANFFEVGSNLYNLKIRNQITEYSGLTDLNGLFLSGTSNGFVLAPISSIEGVDTYLTGGTYSAEASTLTLELNDGTDVIVTGVTNGKLDTVLLDSYNGTRLKPIDTSLNGFHISKSINGNIGYSVFNTDDSGNGAQANFTAKGSGALYTNNTGISHFGANYFIPYLRGNGILYSDKQLFVAATNNNNIDFRTGSDLGSATSKFNINSGGTLTIGVKPTVDNTVIDLLGRKSDGTVVVVEGSGLTDTYVTGFTYSPTNNTLTIKQNEGQSDLNVQISSMSGLSLTNLTEGRVVYVGADGLLTDKIGFTYDSNTNTLSVPNDGAVNVGTGGLSVLGDAVIQGSLQVFGPSVSAFTSQLYVEDDNITLNYNPTGNTTTTSIGSGWMIQDGNGINGGNVNLNINRLDTLTGITSTQIPNISEYTSSTGYANRGWVTQLNDIVIRSTNISTPNGVRVLAEFDILDGGQY